MNKKFYTGIVLGLFIGIISSGLITYKLISKDKYEFGKHQGYIIGGMDVIKFLSHHFSNDQNNTKVPLYFDFKDIRIQVKEINNIKTIEIK